MPTSGLRYQSHPELLKVARIASWTFRELERLYPDEATEVRLEGVARVVLDYAEELDRRDRLVQAVADAAWRGERVIPCR